MMDYRPRSKGIPGTAIAVVGGVIALVLVIGLFASAVSVDAGEACVIRRFGEPQKVANSGLQWTNPAGRSTACYTTRSVVYETVDENPSDSNSNADYLDYAVDGTTVDGQSVTVTFTLRYRVNKDELIAIHETVGPNMDTVQERVTKFHSRTVTRQIVNQHTASELYLGGLDPVSEEIYEALVPRFAESHLTLEAFELKRPGFGEEYTAAVEKKQLRTEEAAAAKNQQEVARQEAETKKINAQADADAKVIEAEGDAEALRIEGEAYRAYPELMQVRGIEALSNANLIVVPNESMPIIDMGDTEPVEPTPEPTPEPEG
ncbi:prohibitin-1, mitochondrial-like [Tenebrio molitor]|uniref:prohibitin-1, mitochondrial-like n=1 Tax=Tenebrio molitor TaxID=7067 RepID=UPI003624A9A7